MNESFWLAEREFETKLLEFSSSDNPSLILFTVDSYCLVFELSTSAKIFSFSLKVLSQSIEEWLFVDISFEFSFNFSSLLVFVVSLY